MNAVVDTDACTGCELCVQTCPEMFEMDDSGVAVAKPGAVPPGGKAACRLAASECPVEAISVAE
jgi:ferredoxin